MVTVVMTTYNPTPDAPRFDYARRCIDALSRRLRVSSENAHLLLADDGSPVSDSLAHLVHRWARDAKSGFITGAHGGIGASLNRALAHVDGSWMYTTDDWLLTEPLDLELPLWLLTPEGGSYDIVRLGPIHPNLMCWTKFTQGHGWWLDITQNGHGFIFATRPFLASADFTARFGPFDEGLNAYETERLFAERFNRLGGRAAAINLTGPWEHIGEFEVGDLFHAEKVGVS